MPIRVLVRNPGRLPADLQDPRVEVVVGDLCRNADLDRRSRGSSTSITWRGHTSKPGKNSAEHEIEVTRQVAEACLASEGQAVDLHRHDRLLLRGCQGQDDHRGDASGSADSPGAITMPAPRPLSEQILMAMHREKGLPVVIFRPGIVIGRGGSPFHWGVGMWSWNAVCQIWGQGRNPLPLVLVEDVAQALVAASMPNGIEGESFNLVADSTQCPGLPQSAGAMYRRRVSKDPDAALEVLPCSTC